MTKCWGALIVAVVVVATASAACTPSDPGGGDPSTTTTSAPTSTTVPATTTTTVAPPTTVPPTTASTTSTTLPPAETPGLTNPALLTDYTGPSTLGSGTVVIENKRITGRLTIDGADVTIRNSLVEFEDWYHVWVKSGSVLIEHSELDGLNTSTMGDDNGVAGANVTVRWSVFRNLVNGMNLSSGSTAEHNLIHQPNTAYAGAHSDGIEVYGGSDVVIRSNTIVVTGGEGETGCVNIATDFGDIDDVLVEDNDMTGGTATLYVRLQGQGEAVTNVRVRSNRFHRPHIYHPYSVDPRSAVVEWSGNTLDGAPLNL